MPSHHTVADSDDEDADAAPGGDGVENMLVRCTELKTKGNEHFKAGELGAATTAYEEAVSKLTSKVGKKALGDYFKARPGAMDTASPLLASLHTNLAAVHVKAQQWQSALKAATEALKVEPQNIKARFRRGVAESNVLPICVASMIDRLTMEPMHTRPQVDSVLPTLAKRRARGRSTSGPRPPMFE